MPIGLASASSSFFHDEEALQAGDIAMPDVNGETPFVHTGLLFSSRKRRSVFLVFFAVFLLCGHTAANVPLRFVGIQNFFDLSIQLGIDCPQAFRDVFVYGRPKME